MRSTTPCKVPTAGSQPLPQDVTPPVIYDGTDVEAPPTVVTAQNIMESFPSGLIHQQTVSNEEKSLPVDNGVEGRLSAAAETVEFITTSQVYSPAIAPGTIPSAAPSTSPSTAPSAAASATPGSVSCVSSVRPCRQSLNNSTPAPSLANTKGSESDSCVNGDGDSPLGSGI